LLIIVCLFLLVTVLSVDLRFLITHLVFWNISFIFESNDLKPANCTACCSYILDSFSYVHHFVSLQVFFISVDVNKQINLAIFLCPTLVRKFILIRWRIDTLRWECDLCCLFVHFPNILHGTVAHTFFYCFSMAYLYTTGRTKWTDTSHRTIQIAVWHMLLFWIRFVEKISLKNVLRC